MRGSDLAGDDDDEEDEKSATARTLIAWPSAGASQGQENAAMALKIPNSKQNLGSGQSHICLQGTECLSMH